MNRDQHNELSEFWNAITEGREPSTAVIDPGLAETIEHLEALTANPLPDVARVRVREMLLKSMGSDGTGQNPGVVATGQIPVPVQVPRGTKQLETTRRSFWRRLPLASVAAVLLALVVSASALFTLVPVEQRPAFLRGSESGDGDVQLYGLDPSQRRSATIPGPLETPVLQWQVQSDTRFSSAPVVVDGTVYVSLGSNEPEEEQFGGGIAAYDLETGQERWTFDAAGPVESSPAVSGSTIFFADSTGVLYALDRSSGEEQWRFTGDLAGWAGSPVKLNGAVYYVMTDQTGLNIAGAGDQLFVAGGKIDKGGRARARLSTVYALDAEAGTLRWQFSDFPADSGALIALDAESGSIEWTQTWKAVAISPAVEGDRVYVGTGGNPAVVRAVDTATGNEVWSTELGQLWGSDSGFTVSGASVAVRESMGPLHVFEADSGVLRWSSAMATEEFTEAPAPFIAGDVVYALSSVGQVYAFALDDGSPLWQVSTKTGLRYESFPAFVVNGNWIAVVSKPYKHSGVTNRVNYLVTLSTSPPASNVN